MKLTLKKSKELIAYMHVYRKVNREKIRKQRQQYYQENKDKWRKNNDDN